MRVLRELSIAFLARHPDKVWQWLLRYDEQKVATFLAKFPPERLSALLRQVGPRQMVRWMACTQNEVAGHWLEIVPRQVAATALRLVDERKREAWLACLGSECREAIKGLLQFSRHHLGSRMDPHYPALDSQKTVKQVREALSNVWDGGGNGSIIFVLGTGGKLLGQVEYRQLFMAREDDQLGTLMVPVARTFHPLDPWPPRRSVLDEVLPVVGDQGLFLGAVLCWPEEQKRDSGLGNWQESLLKSGLGRRIEEHELSEAELVAEFIRCFPDEAVDLVEHLDPFVLLECFEILPSEAVRRWFPRFSPRQQVRIFEEAAPQKWEVLARALDVSGLVSLLEKLPVTKRSQVLSKLSDDLADTAKARLAVPSRRVGRWMQSPEPVLRTDETLRAVVEKLSQVKEGERAVLLVVKKGDVLVGMVHVNRLHGPLEKRTVAEVMEPIGLSCREDEETTAVVERLSGCSASSLPVLNQSGSLVGSLHGPALLSMLRNEVKSHLLEQFGVESRSHWFVGMVSLLMLGFAAMISLWSVFQGSLEKFPLLALLIPLVMRSAGWGWMQGLAEGVSRKMEKNVGWLLWLHLFEQVWLGMMLAALGLGLVAGLGTWAALGSAGYAWAAGIAVFLAAPLGTATGAVLAPLLRFTGIDSRVAAAWSGWLSDVIAVSILLWIGTLLLGHPVFAPGAS